MKRRIIGIVLILALILSFSLVTAGTVAAEGSAYQDGADRLAGLQNNDGGWDWPLNDGDPDSASPLNTIGPIGMGLAQAYLITNDPDHLDALNGAKGLLLTKTNNFSPPDGYLAVILDSILGGTACTDYVRNNYYDKLTDGTYTHYQGPGGPYDTEGYIQYLRDRRDSGGIANVAAWDLGMGLVAAATIGADTTAWIDSVKAEIDELDGDTDYDVLGLAGAVYGLAFIDEDFDPTAGEHASAGSLEDLADILGIYQLDSGGFTYSSNELDEGMDNETIQETAYATLALVEMGNYETQTDEAMQYIASVQLGTGGWENSVGDPGENNELTGEALWALALSNSPPVADAGPNVEVTDTDEDGFEDVALNGSGSYDVDGTIESYEWKEGDTTLSDQTSFTYSYPVGAHVVTLTVTDDLGATDSDWLFVTVDTEGGCFIATAAFGTPMAEEIDILRDFRDQYMLTNPVGEALVKLYYNTSPPVADFIADHPALKHLVRAGLEPVIAVSTVVVKTTLIQKLVIVSSIILTFTIVVVWLRRKAGDIKPLKP